MKDKETDDIVNEVFAKACIEPIALFYTLGLEEYISTTILNQQNGDKFEFTLKKLKS